MLLDAVVEVEDAISCPTRPEMHIGDSMDLRVGEPVGLLVPDGTGLRHALPDVRESRTLSALTIRRPVSGCFEWSCRCHDGSTPASSYDSTDSDLEYVSGASQHVDPH